MSFGISGYNRPYSYAGSAGSAGSVGSTSDPGGRVRYKATGVPGYYRGDDGRTIYERVLIGHNADTGKPVYSYNPVDITAEQLMRQMLQEEDRALTVGTNPPSFNTPGGAGDYYMQQLSGGNYKMYYKNNGQWRLDPNRSSY